MNAPNSLTSRNALYSRSDYQLIRQNHDATQVLSETLEASLIHAMDQALESLCETFFVHGLALEQFEDLISEKDNINEDVLDQWLTLRDILLLHRYLGKDPNHESKALIKLAAKWVVAWPTDRDKLFATLSELESELAPYEQGLVQQLNQEYLKARNRLVNANLKLVAHLSNRYRDKGLDTEELIQEGTIGVVQAANRFNSSLGNRFTTYAYWWIQQSLKQALSDKRGAVRLPTNVTDRISSIERFKQRFVSTYGKQPNAEELSRFSQLDKDMLVSYEQIGNLGLSLNEPSFEDDDEQQQDKLVIEHNPVENALLAQDEKRLLNRLINTLNPRQQTVVRLYHGLNIHHEQTFKEIAPQLGVTLERTRQIYHEAMAKLRENFADLNAKPTPKEPI